MTKRIPLSQLVTDDARAATLVALGLIRKAVLEEGATVVVQGFGTFAPRHRAARVGRNPATGEAVQIEAGTSLGFRPSKGGK